MSVNNIINIKAVDKYLKKDVYNLNNDINSI